MTEELYDKEYIAIAQLDWTNGVPTLGERMAYPNSRMAGSETGVPAREACRSQGAAKHTLQWALRVVVWRRLSLGNRRAMGVALCSGHGQQTGVNFGNLTTDAPVDLYFYFLLCEGGISGELAWTAAAQNCTRMPHILSMNPVKQMVPRRVCPRPSLRAGNGVTAGWHVD
jgi:trimethylamine-N-oxide reductase (cytochrome c)